VDKVIVLRAAPRVLKERLASRVWSEEKLRENIEAEALDVILVESLEANKKVYEIDTTNMTTMQVKEAVVEIIKGTDKYAPGSIDFSEDVFL
jgi:adenylate kinase